MKWRLMPRDFFQYLIEMCRVFVAAELAGGVSKTLRLLVLFRHTTVLREASMLLRP
ncbi:MAG TPA: hypothetical protein VIH87_02140 [Methylocella sp.]